MTKEQMLNLIKVHNETVNFTKHLPDIKISAEALFALMPLSSRIASEGHEITKLAREMGINAKCDMQSGEVHIYTSGE